MFDTAAIAKKIKQARIEKNMTQLNLADAMGVSYQAVSNWERGNSMPDISKLGDLCATLGLTVNELLGVEENGSNAVVKAVNQENLTMEELVEVAPMLPPEEVKAQVEEKRVWPGPDMRFLKEEQTIIEQNREDDSRSEKKIKVFLKGMKETIKKAEDEKKQKKTKKLDFSKIADLAPFLDQEYLDKLVMEADLSDLDDLDELAPFLSHKALDYLAEHAYVDDLDELAEIAPFLSRQTLEKLVCRCEDSYNFDALEALAPFVPADVLDGFIDRYIQKGSDADLYDLYPYLSTQTLRKLANYMMENKDLDGMEEILPYV